MSQADDVVRSTAEAILAARSRGHVLSAPFEGRILDESQAYAVQHLVVAARISRGERPAGWKLGYTSAAMREQMGVAQPNLGPLTDAMLLDDGAVVPATVLQPKVEPEIALVMASDVTSRTDAEGIAAHVASARAALEVVDSVWDGYRFGWADNTADGSSAAYVVLGPEVGIAGCADLAVVLLHNGQPVGRGRGADAMGDPLVALAWLSDRLLERGQWLRAGDVVITGGLTRAVALEPGDVVSATIGDARVEVRREASSGNRSIDGGKVGS
ncbi:MAG: fumarylacetoacetate hydrolase family protein [Actinobacteria bacterium]|jgi:2-keto-4-pentenoate hydratase|nr:fumarylacetoacetate hydrolase family protein [Actinomycetota bacterium]